MGTFLKNLEDSFHKQRIQFLAHPQIERKQHYRHTHKQ